MFWNYISERHQIIRTFFSGIGKTAVIYPAAFMTAIAGGTMMLGIIFFVNDVFEATPSQVGWLVATWSCCYCAGCILMRPIFRRMLPRYSMLLAFTLMFLSVLGIILSPSLAWVFFLYGFSGLSTAFFWPPVMGWLFLRIEGEELSREMGRFNVCWSFGVIISPILAGSLSEIDPGLPIRFTCALYLALVFMILGAILTISSLRQDDHVHTEERTETTDNVNSTFLRFPSWLGLLTAYTVYGAILAIFPISAPRDLHISKGLVGMLFFMRALMGAAGFAIMGRTKFWHFRTGPMVIGMLILGVITLLMAGAQSILIIGLLLAMVGLFMAQSYANSLFHGASRSTQRSSRMAIHEFLLSVGLIFGGALGGMIYQRWNMTALYLFCSALLFATAGTQLILTVWHNKRQLNLSATRPRRRAGGTSLT